MSSDYNRQLQAKRAYYAYMEGYSYAIRECAFAPTSCAACRSANGERVSLETVMHGMADHVNGKCTFTFVKVPAAPPAPVVPEPPASIPPPVTIDPCKTIRDDLVEASQERTQYQNRASMLMRKLQADGNLSRQEAADTLIAMFDAMARASMYDTTIARLQRELYDCETGGLV